ncbi:phage tail-collar fiber domain-containing protein [Escherichia coli]|uniref:phage tail-collar fiber domain-containing protein n=1 Tax=Escherichia coli TaxID=562 RepID=UPI00098C85F3|nr:phage tail protein [Escherichia coli]
MSALLTKAFEKWVAECTASNLPARPDAIIFALMEREPTREDDAIPEEKITYIVNELTYGQLSQNNIVCSAVVPDDSAFSYDWICLIHQASRTLCGVIKTPVRQKVTGESLIRNFTIIYSGIAQSAQVTAPPQSWQVDITPELKTALKAPNRLSEIADEGEEAQQESRDNLGLKKAATMEPQNGIRDRSEGRLATPGAFGFGHIFIPGEAVRFNSDADFLAWIRYVEPGEYYVDGANGVLPGIVFRGVISIRWLEANQNPPLPSHTAKAIIFYGINGNIYYNRYWSTGNGWLTGWENLKVNEVALRELIETRAPLESPEFTGKPTIPTPPDDAADNEIASVAFVRKQIESLDIHSSEDPAISSAPTNLLSRQQSGDLFVDGTHPVIPKVAASTLNSNLDSFKSLPDGSRIYAMELDVSNPVRKSSVGGVGIVVSALLEPRYLYMNQNRKYIPAQYFVGSVSATASTITVRIRVVMPDTPYYALDTSTLEETASAENGPLPCVVVAKIFAGTTLRQNGMG